MKKKVVSKFIAGVLVCTCMLGVAAPHTLIAEAANVGTVSYNITVGKKVSPAPLSKRSAKRDNEQNAYVTATAFSDIGKVSFVSIRKAGGIRSSVVSIKSSEINKRKKMVYQGSATAGELYYMKGIWNAGPNTLNVKGRYTP